MAVNESRSMNAELQQGLIDGRYIQLAPNWSVNANPPTERMEWPTYQRAERHRTQNVRQVSSVDNHIVSVARDQHAVEAGHSQPHTWVDRGIYNSVSLQDMLDSGEAPWERQESGS